MGHLEMSLPNHRTLIWILFARSVWASSSEGITENDYTPDTEPPMDAQYEADTPPADSFQPESLAQQAFLSPWQIRDAAQWNPGWISHDMKKRNFRAFSPQSSVWKADMMQRGNWQRFKPSSKRSWRANRPSKRSRGVQQSAFYHSIPIWMLGVSKRSGPPSKAPVDEALVDKAPVDEAPMLVVSKRSPGCLRNCLVGSSFHPAQCHAFC